MTVTHRRMAQCVDCGAKCRGRRCRPCHVATMPAGIRRPCIGCGVRCRGTHCQPCYTAHLAAKRAAAKQASDPLLDRVLRITDREQPCREVPDAWYSASPDVTDEAAELCLTCPLIDACRRAGEGELWGVWAGEVKHQTRARWAA